MENASKALMMAGGVLIALLAISLAVFLFIDFGQRASEMQEKIQDSQITEFNSKFTVFETDPPTATIYDVISVARFAKEYNVDLEEADQLKIYFDNNTNRIDNKDIDTDFYIRSYAKITRDDTANTVRFTDDSLFKCIILNGDEFHDSSGRILGVLFTNK